MSAIELTNAQQAKIIDLNGDNPSAARAYRKHLARGVDPATALVSDGDLRVTYDVRSYDDHVNLVRDVWHGAFSSKGSHLLHQEVVATLGIGQVPAIVTDLVHAISREGL